MELGIAVAGSTINNMVKAQKLGQMVQHSKENIKLEKRMEKENLFLQMAQFMREILSLMKFLVLEFISG